MHRRRFAVIPLSALLALGAVAVAQEAIEPLPPKQQDVQILRPAEPQQVERIDQSAKQEIRKNEIPTQGQRTASTVGKVAVGILAAAVAIGASAASLLFL